MSRVQDEVIVQNGWTAHLVFCEQERRRIFAQLEPLEGGGVHIARRYPMTGGTWIDITNDEIKRLRKDIANLDALIAKSRFGVA